MLTRAAAARTVVDEALLARDPGANPVRDGCASLSGPSRERHMGVVVKFRRPAAAIKAQGKTLCASGFHKWRIAQKKQFDVQRGRLVTQHRCERCGATKTTLD